MKKTLSLVGLILGTLICAISWQCKKEDVELCDCPPITRPYMSLAALGFTHQDISKGFLPNDVKEVAAKDHRIFFNGLLDLIADAMPISIPNPFITSALACNCIADGWKGWKSRLKSVTFRTINDYDDKYKAGAVINDLLGMASFYPIPIATDKSIALYIEEIKEAPMLLLNTNEAIKFNHTRAFLEKLNENKTATLQISVEAIFEDGSVITKTSLPVTIFP